MLREIIHDRWDELDKSMCKHVCNVKYLKHTRTDDKRSRKDGSQKINKNHTGERSVGYKVGVSTSLDGISILAQMDSLIKMRWRAKTSTEILSEQRRSDVASASRSQSSPPLEFLLIGRGMN